MLWTKARRIWLRSRANDTQGKAGRLYEHLMAATLGCVITKRGDYERGDIYSNDLGIRVEIKARGDVNTPELRVNQIQEYEEGEPFPLSYTLYALVLYRSTLRLKDGDPRPKGIGPNTHMLSLLRSIRKDDELNRFFASNIQLVYLLDLRVISALKDHLGTIGCRMVGRREEQAVRIGRMKLDELFGNDERVKNTLRKLGIRPSGWAKGVYPIQTRFSIDGQRLKSDFTLITVLRKGLHASVASALAQKSLTLE